MVYIFYLPGRLLRQFNISQDIPLALNNFSEEHKFVTPYVSLSVERMWRGRLIWQFLHARFGISRPLLASIIRSIWQLVGVDLANDPYQMCCFRFMAVEPTEDLAVFTDVASEQFVFFL